MGEVVSHFSQAVFQLSSKKRGEEGKNLELLQGFSIPPLHQPPTIGGGPSRLRGRDLRGFLSGSVKEKDSLGGRTFSKSGKADKREISTPPFPLNPAADSSEDGGPQNIFRQFPTICIILLRYVLCFPLFILFGFASK